jgi:hypothetical protein
MFSPANYEDFLLSTAEKFGLYLVLPNTTERNGTGSNRTESGWCLAGYPAKEKRVTTA